jgi:hypothetical protein
MRFSLETFDYRNPKLILSNPQRKKIGLIQDVREFNIKPYFNSISEITFKLYKETNGVKNKYYNRLVIDKLILVKGLSWFQVKKVEIKQDNDSKVQYKEITCLTAENDLIYRKIDNVVGVYSLYDITDTEHSLLHIVEQYSNWSVGHIDANLLNKWRTLNVDSEKIYNLLTTTISTSFNCVFDFDTFNKTINAYELENFGDVTNITISDKNILQSYVQESDLDKISTKIRVVGGQNSDGTQFDIRAVNPTGMDYITDFSYYMTTEWMSQSLIDSLTAYNLKYDNYKTQYSTTLSLLKQYNVDLTTLKSDLNDIESQIEAQNQVIGVSVQNHNGSVPISTDTDYTIYQNAISQLSILNGQKATKQVEISAKEMQIANTQSTLDNISVDLSMSSNFTQEQLAELDCFVKEGDSYEDSTFCATDTMAQEEILDMKLELMNNAMNELKRCSRPQYTINTTLSNLFTIQDGKDSKVSFESWKKQFVTGNLITLKFRDNYHITVRLMSMNIDCDNGADIDVIFSDKNRLDDELVQLAEIIAQADRATSAYTLKTMGYDAASKQTSSFIDFKNGTLNATYNQMVSDDNAQVSIDRYGIHIREWQEDRNDYSPYQMWLNPYRMLFSSDGFKSASSAFGLLTTPNGEKVMGINTDLFIGRIMMSENVFIENKSGTYKFDLNGFNATATLNGNTYSVGIIPNVPSSIFQILVNGSKKLYVDTVNNRLVVNGEINATSGTLGDLTVTGIITGGVFNGTTFNGATGNFTGSITATSGNIGGFTIDSTQLTAGTGNKFMRISPYSTTPGTNNYSTSVGAIDLGRTSDGLDTLIHLRSDGYARFGLNSVAGSVRFNNSVMEDGYPVIYPFYTSNFKISQNGSVFCDWIQSKTSLTLWGSTKTLIGSDSTLEVNAAKIKFILNVGETYDSFTFNGSRIITASNIGGSHAHGTLYANSNIGDNSVYFSSYGNWVSTSAGDIGTSSNVWDGAYFRTAPTITSDRNQKNSITDLEDVYRQIVLRLKPVKFKYNNGTSDRWHTGFIAQDVEDLLLELGLDSKDFAGFIKSPIYSTMNENGEFDTTSEINGYVYSLRYEEFISPTISVVQELKRELDNLKEKVGLM